MTVDQLPGPIATSTRDREIERFKRSYRIRMQNGDPTVVVDTGDGSQVDIDARICADIVMPLYAAAKTSSDNSVLEQARGKALKQWGAREGVGDPLNARGASGIITIKASVGGGFIPADQELRHKASSLRYRVITGQHYDDGDQCAIVGKDTGPATNQPAGTQLEWTSPPPGIGDTVIVLADVSGNGLSGGADQEAEDDYRARIEQEKQSRAASGNDAEYQLVAESTPEVAVQKAFTVPCWFGPGSTCLICTVRPAHPGGSRAPSSTQMALVESQVVGEFPGDDGATFGLLAEDPADICYSINWSDGALGWQDKPTWPDFYAAAPISGPAAIVVTAATSATSFTLATSNANYSGVRQPTAGQTIGFYDRVDFSFKRKRILSFTGTGPWVVTCDTTNNTSDTGFTPEVGQRTMPWSDSLDAILFTEGQQADGAQEGVPASGVLAYFDTLGPGEQFSSFYDEGTRQRRQPRPPKSWPSKITTRGLIDAITAAQVQDVDALEGDGLQPGVGVPGVLARYMLLRWIAVFPGT